MQTDFSSNYVVDRMIDESLVDNAFPDEIVELFYRDGVADSFAEYSIDFGGGVFGITCRSVLRVCEDDPSILMNILGLRKTKENKSLCVSILAVCKQQISSSAYLL